MTAVYLLIGVLAAICLYYDMQADRVIAQAVADEANRHSERTQSP